MATKVTNQTDATTLIVRSLRAPDHGTYSGYGYGLYLPALVRTYLEANGVPRQDVETQLREVMPHFYAAAWDLCRRGILRPGVKAYGAQATADGSSGNGYTVTPFGAQWLNEADKDDFVPTEPERFAAMLTPYTKRFSPAFQERAQEAIRCYGAHAYLACCAMCGAAAETILLSPAIAKSNEAEVLAAYLSSGGRRRVENMVVGKAREELREEYRSYMSLLKYWRDSAAHGRAASIGDNEAYTSLALLLRFAIFVNDNWPELST